MFRLAILLAVLFQAGLETRPTIVAKQVGPPRRNVWIIYYDDSFLFASRHALVALARRDLVVTPGAAVRLHRLVRVDVAVLELVE